MKTKEWLLCPVCKDKTRLQIRNDTEMNKFPLFCTKCKQETLIDVRDLLVTIHKEIPKE